MRTSLFTAAAVLALLAHPAMAADAAADADGPKDVAEIVVTGAPYVVSVESTTTSVDIVKREDLDTAAAAGLGDVLAHLPGVRSSFFGPGASRPVIRGLSGARVQVLTNGVGMIDASGLSPDHQVASDPQEAERIEVLRGPSALAYGGSAIGGIVNIIDERVPSHFEEGVHGRMLGSASSVDDGRMVSGAVKAGLGERWMFTADGVHRTSDNYDVPVAPMSQVLAQALGEPAQSRASAGVANSFSELTAYGAGGSYVGDKAWGGLSVKHTKSEYGSPAEEDVHIGLRQTRVDARGGADVDWGLFDQVKVAGGWADYKHTEFEGDEVGTIFLSKGLEGRVELVQPSRDGWQGAVGVQALKRDFDAIGDEALIPATKIREWGAFTLQRLDKEAWGVEGGLRIDARNLKSNRGERDFTNVSGSLGLFARPAEGWFLGASLSRTSRAPTEEELFSLGAHPATAAYEIGDPSLAKEVSYSLDTTIHRGGDAWHVDLHGFYVDYDNFIDLSPTGQVDADSGFQEFRFVSSTAKFYGAEAEASWRVWHEGDRGLHIELVYDYVHGQTANGPAVRIPPWSVTARGIVEGQRWTGAVEVRQYGEQTRIADFELPTDGYTMLNASLVVRPIPGKPDFKVFLDADNLTNVEAREHASFLKDVAPLPGRNVRLGVGYRF